MELDELKNIWNSESGREKGAENNLLFLLGKTSNSPVARMRRNLKIEIWVVAITYTATIVYYFLAWNGTLRGISWFMLLTGILFLAYYYFKYRLLSQVNGMEKEVKAHLKKQVSTLEKYTRFYLVAGTAIVPVAMLFFGWLLYQRSAWVPEGLPELKKIPSLRNLISILSLTGIVTVITFFLNRWYIQKLYGDHINSLKQKLSEMES